MATTCFFEEKIYDQGGEITMDVEFGRSSFYAGCEVPAGIGEDSIYLKVDDNGVVMDRETAKKFVDAVLSVGRYHGLVD